MFACRFIHLLKFLSPALILSCNTLLASEASPGPHPPAPLSFEAAYQDLLQKACELKGLDAAVKAKEASRWQASLYINPELNVGIEALGSQNDNCNTPNGLSVGVTQLVELGGKRKARIGAAEAALQSTCWDLRMAQTELFSELLHAFVHAAAAEKKLELRQKQLAALEEAADCFRKKNAAGKTSLVQLKRAEINLKTGQLKLTKAQAERASAHQQLQALWDGCAPAYETLQFELDETPALPLYSVLAAHLENTPELGKADAEVELAAKTLQVERAGRYPDIAVQIGVAACRFTEDPSLTLGFTIPLQLSDRNQGNICRANFEYSEALYNRMTLLCHLKAQLEGMLHSWEATYREVMEIRDSLLPLVNESYQLAKMSFDEGKIECLELLEARGELFEMEEMFLDALEEYHNKRADVLTLTFCNNN